MIIPLALKCEYAVNPLGIDTPRPRFSWVLESHHRGQAQSAYQVLVASSEDRLEANVGDKWDSGKVVSDQSANVAYEGSLLTSSETCWWKVRVWDADDNASPWSGPATFEMGLLNGSDWDGKWIAASVGISSPLLRKEFVLDREVRRARVHIAGLGYYEMYVNGDKVGDHVLDPGQTYYNNDQPFDLGSRVLYVTYDVTDQLLAGLNAMGVMLGHGWYSAEADVPPAPSSREPYGQRPVLLLQMNVELADGERVSVVSDRTWSVSEGPIRYNDYCNGEVYDARLEIPGWDSPGYDASDWDQALEVRGPGGALVAQMIPPIKVVQTLKPVGILHPKDGVYVYDFGQNFSGWSRLHVSGPSGTEVTLRHGACVYEDGSLDVRSSMFNCPDSDEEFRQGIGRDGRPHLCARQTDRYILRGEGTEVWEPRFTLHGFRYVEVTGFPGMPGLENLEGRHVRSALDAHGAFTCSNPLINQIHSNVCWTLASSLQSVPQDAADRCERVAWLGDPVPEDYVLNWDAASFWTKWVDDIRDSQKPDGEVPVVSPIHWRRTQDPYERFPAWASTYPFTVWSVYWFYDDVRILAEHYDGLTRLLDFFAANASDHILSFGLGDHMEPQPDGLSSFRPQHTLVALTSTAYYYFDTCVVAQAAELLGKTEDAERHARLAEAIKAAFNREFLDEDTNQYGTGSQASNAIALYFGLVPPERVDAVLENLVDDIVTAHGGHLTTGILGTNALAQVLTRHGRADVMYQIASQTTFPSWGYMISKGATTIWETWDGVPERGHSRNMKMFCTVDKFFYKGLAGISPAAPGYKRITIRPCVVGDLESAQASIRTIRGLVDVNWTRGDRSFKVGVAIPVNTIAVVSIPKLGMQEISISEGGQPLWKDGKLVGGIPGIDGGCETADYVEFEVGSGQYSFELS